MNRPHCPLASCVFILDGITSFAASPPGDKPDVLLSATREEPQRAQTSLGKLNPALSVLFDELEVKPANLNRQKLPDSPARAITWLSYAAAADAAPAASSACRTR